MVADFNETARCLMRGVLQDRPDWEKYAVPYGPADDREALPGSVTFSIPVPQEPTHHLEIALRGNTIEVAYECGPGCGRAEQQFVFDESEAELAIAAVTDFVRGLLAGRTVVVRERLGAVVRALRRGNVTELAWFRSADEAQSAPAGKYAAVHVWGGDSSA